MSRKLGYARVSTEDQHLELQIDALKAAGVEVRDIFMEKMSGSKKDRPELERLLPYAQPGDTIVVWKLVRNISRCIKLNSSPSRSNWIHPPPLVVSYSIC